MFSEAATEQQLVSTAFEEEKKSQIAQQDEPKTTEQQLVTSTFEEEKKSQTAQQDESKIDVAKPAPVEPSLQ